MSQGHLGQIGRRMVLFQIVIGVSVIHSFHGAIDPSIDNHNMFGGYPYVSSCPYRDAHGRVITLC